MKSILFISRVQYNFLKQRPHFISKYLYENGYKVYFFEEPEKLPLRLIKKNKIRKLGHNFSIMGNNKLLNFRPILGISFININNKINLRFLKKHLNPFDEYIVITEDYLYFDYYELKESFKVKRLIYDCVDLHEYFDEKNKEFRLKYEFKLAEIADMIICSSKELQKKFSKFNTIFIPNGVDFQKFYCSSNKEDDPLIKEKVRKGYKIVLGYIGAIEDWFNFDLINKVLVSSPEIRVVLLGTMNNRMKKRFIKLRSNFSEQIEFIGFIPHDMLPYYIKYFDFGLIPFNINHPVIKGVNPLKLYEYFAVGKSVIADIWDEISYLYDKKKLITFEDFILNMEFYLSLVKDENIINDKIKIAKDHSWKQLISKVIEVIE